MSAIHDKFTLKTGRISYLAGSTLYCLVSLLQGADLVTFEYSLNGLETARSQLFMFCIAV
jgi:hypothetical protein